MNQNQTAMEKINRSKSVNAVPKGYHSVTPYLVVDNAAGLIEFIEKAFNGKLTFKTLHDDNRIMHATVTIGDSTIMISDTMEGMEAHTAMLYLYLENVDEIYQQAIDAKSTSVSKPRDEFYGDRVAAVKDSWGNVWWIATHVENLDQQEMEKRKTEFEEQSRDHEVHV
jgi:PhnB protein